MGKYSDQKVKENSRFTASQIRANKCQKSKSRNAERKRLRIEKEIEIQTVWRALSLPDQLQFLNVNFPKGARKQKDKIKKKLAELDRTTH